MTHSQFFPENNQRVVFFDNGYAISRICNNFFHGCEILVFKWKKAEPSRWERLKLRLGLIENFFYDSLGDAKENLAQSEKWNEGMGVYEYLTPEEERAVFKAIEELEETTTQ